MSDDVEEQITEARNELHAVKRKLDFLITVACPGDHALVQHRDMKPAWCEACGRSSMGLTIGKPR